MTGDEPDILEMIIRHELAIKQLYERFAGMFTNRKDFWQRLAEDEQRHADTLGMLRPESNVNKLLLHEGQIKPQAIKLSIAYVESQIERAQKGNINILQALSIAKDVESALLEKQFSKLSDFASKEMRAILVNLANETERHRKAIVEVLDAEKQKNA
jgi:rubrerythrin